MLLVGILSPLHQVTAQTDYSVPITFSVTSTGINRFIASQWSSIERPWITTYQSLTCTLDLKRPTILLLPNTIKIILALTCTSSVYTGSITLAPTLTIPSTTLSASNIAAQYSDLHQQILNVVTDARLQYVIEQALASISWIMYQGKVMDNSTTRLTETADISLYGLPTLTVNVQNGEIDFTITPVFRVAPPSYSFYWVRPANKTFGVRVKSNDQFVIQNLKVFIDMGGDELSELNLTQSNPTTASWNSSEGKYIADYYVNSVNDLNNGLYRVTYSIKLSRQSSETLWCELCIPPGGVMFWGGTTFNSFYAQSSDGTTLGE
jgi:hypothetical protein